MALLVRHLLLRYSFPPPPSSSSSTLYGPSALRNSPPTGLRRRRRRLALPSPLTSSSTARRGKHGLPAISASASPLDLTEENIHLVLADARTELAQLFDASVGITGVVDLAELDGPFVKLRLQGRFWHKRSTVLTRLGTYLQSRIPEILEVGIEDEKQLDDSPENF